VAENGKEMQQHQLIHTTIIGSRIGSLENSKVILFEKKG
jgi:hypothetical protein